MKFPKTLIDTQFFIHESRIDATFQFYKCHAMKVLVSKGIMMWVPK